jgi:hypothetical protein
MQKEFIGRKKTGNEYRQPAYATHFPSYHGNNSRILCSIGMA